MSRTLSTVQAAVRVLECFDADHTEWTLSELARHLGQPTSSLHEQLSTLTATGLLTRIGRGRYRLGWRLLKLSSALYGSLPWYSLAHSAMERLARMTYLLAFVSVLENEQVYCVARSVQGRDGSAVMGESRFELPPHATASGKLLLALGHLPLPVAAPAFTPQTLTMPAIWEQETQAIRQQKYAQSVDEWQVGTSGLAVPFYDQSRSLLGVLGVSLPTYRLREKEQLLRMLQDAADNLSWQLGHRSGLGEG